jgi:glycosyltransferase involved in cell wall biosynthesis
MNHQLAIVIPIYKSRFLKETLQSVANQTDIRFNLYLYNDASTENIEEIVNPFKDKLSYTYHCFTENLGSVSLPRHWKRCIDNTNNESWVWLLPDDDVIESDCVAEFYKTTEQLGFNYELIRFKTVHINENGLTIRINSIPPTVETGFDFLIEKLNHRRNSTVAEYIFSREAYKKANGFPEFPLAWTSDEALWFSIAGNKGIFTCPNGMVSLRQSSLNISNDLTKYNYKKLDAVYQFFSWLIENEYFIKETRNPVNKTRFIRSSQFYIFDFLKNYVILLSFLRIIKFAFKNNTIWGDGIIRNFYRLVRFRLNSNK